MYGLIADFFFSARKYLKCKAQLKNLFFFLPKLLRVTIFVYYLT